MAIRAFERPRDTLANRHPARRARNEHSGRSPPPLEQICLRQARNFAESRAPKPSRLAGQLCAGLADTHRVGAVHRDLKASNVVLLKQVRQGSAKLFRFQLKPESYPVGKSSSRQAS
jgi:hypothetical protein